MSSFLRPRRGKNSTAKNTLTSNPLKRGEIFFEVPDGGVGTGQGRLFMGDGSTAYGSLTPFLSIPDATIPSFATAQDTDAKRLTKIATGVKFSELFSNLKALLTSFDSRITTLNNDLYTNKVFVHQVVEVTRTGLSWATKTAHTLDYQSSISIPSGFTIAAITAQTISSDYIVTLQRDTSTQSHKITFFITSNSTVTSVTAYINIFMVKSAMYS